MNLFLSKIERSSTFLVLFVFMFMAAMGAAKAQNLGQTSPPCKSDLNVDPVLQARLNQEIHDYIHDPNIRKSQFSSMITIPVMFFIIEDDISPPDFTAARVQRQLEVLNQEFNPYNFRFCIAQNDPNGVAIQIPPNTTTTNFKDVQQLYPGQNGAIWFESSVWDNITNVTGIPNPHDVMTTEILSVFSQNSGISDDHYMFIYIHGQNSPTVPTCQLGYTFGESFDLGDATSLNGQGIVLDPMAAGGPGCSQCCCATNAGMTAVHEAGHYLGLNHIFNLGNCNPLQCWNSGDGICDTPLQTETGYDYNCVTPCASLTTPTPLCSTPVLKGNHMDYANDDCKDNFTPHQVATMEAVAHLYGSTIIDENNVATVGCASQSIVFVDHNNQGGTQTGTSWATAYADLAQALANATPGDEIWVHAGTYYPSTTSDPSESYDIPNGVRVFGGFQSWMTHKGQRDHDTYLTILNGSVGPQKSYHIVTSKNTDVNTILDGFVIRDADASGSNQSERNGGGILLEQSDITLVNLWFFQNHAANNGAAIYIDGGKPSISRTLFESNTSGANAGAVYTLNSAETCFLNCIFQQNESDVNGAATYHSMSTSLYENCIFSENSTNQFGGGIYNVNSDLKVYNCSFFLNQGDGSICTEGSMTTHVANSAFSQNNHSVVDPDQITTVDYSVLDDGWGGSGTNNLPNDPMFSAPYPNMYLDPSSPCIDHGAKAYAAHNELDVYLQHRIFKPEGCISDQTVAKVDAGAEEYQGECKTQSSFSPTELAATLTIFPNPGTGRVHVNNPIEDQYSVQIFNSMGKRIGATHIGPNTTQQIDLTQEASGIYFLRFTNGKSDFTRKILIQQ